MSRGVAQPGSAHRSGRWGRRFESSLPDQPLQNLKCIELPGFTRFLKGAAS